MTGLLRIVDASGEREAELSRGRMTLGTSRADPLFVKGEGSYPSLLSLSWDPRRATWMLYCPLPLIAPNREPPRGRAGRTDSPNQSRCDRIAGRFSAISTLARAAGASRPANRPDLARQSAARHRPRRPARDGG